MKNFVVSVYFKKMEKQKELVFAQLGLLPMYFIEYSKAVHWLIESETI